MVTVLFADLVGSTTAQERMDPEAVRAANERAYAAMRSAIGNHGGTVVQFVGDGVMAAFGVPEMAEDDAVRALRAAAELRLVFGAALRVGVNTGEVVVTPDDNDVLGDVVNVASRLEHEAPPGETLIGEETYRLTRGAARFGEPRRIGVKGRSAPVAVRLLVDVVDLPAPASVFVGRERELAALLAALGIATGTGQARLATVIGSPGVGKSRLLEELAGAVEDEATVLVGRCDPRGASSLEPVVGIVRDALAAAGGLDQLPVGAAEGTRIAAAVDVLTGAGTAGTPQEMFWAVRRVIELAARQRPVLVVIDDLHWAEPVLLDLVEHLSEWLGPVPVLVVGTGRPELRDLRPSLVEVTARPATVLSLEGLDADATQQLAADLLGASGLPSDLSARVVNATDGNPLFVRELLRMLVDDGVLRQEGGRWILAIDAADIELPSTISALLAARIERLPADERTVLERASILGQEVVQGLLLELLPGAARARAATLLESLRRKELLEPARTYWVDQPVLRFHHILIRDAAYRRVLKATRAELHERAAHWFIDRSGDSTEHDELVGFNLEQALQSHRDLGPIDDHVRAVAIDAGTRLGRAARRALDRDDLPAAAALAARALSCLPEADAVRAEMLLVRCEALLDTGAVTAARDAVDELAVLGAGNDRLRAWGVAYRMQLGLLTGTAALAEAEAAALSAATDLASLGDAAGAAKAYRVRASALARLGRIADTELTLDQALTAAREAGDRRQISGVLAAAPPAALWGPSPVARAGGRCLDVVRLLRITTGAREVEAISIRCQAVLEALRGRRDAALTMLARARGVVEELGLGRGLLDLELAAGMIDLVGGEALSADQHLQTAHDGYLGMGLDADATQAAALRARCQLLEGHDDAALELADGAGAIAGSDLKTAVTWRAVRADVFARRGDREAALALAREAVSLTQDTDALLDHAEALAALAMALEAAGDEAGALDARTDAAALFEQKGATALLDRLRPPIFHPAKALPSAPPNRAARCFAMEWKQDFMAHATPEELRQRLHPEFVHEDRRPGPWERVMDRDRLIENIEVARAMQVPLIRYGVVATRGGDLVLLHQVYGRDGVENDFLALAQYDATDRCIRSILFDTDDLESARAEMERLAADAESGGPIGAPQEICVDDVLIVTQIDKEGRGLRSLRFSPDQVTEALSEVDRVAVSRLDRSAEVDRPDGTPETPAVRSIRTVDACIAEGRWDDFAAQFHPDFVLEDRRSVATVRCARADQLVEGARLFEGGVARSEIIATRGETLVLARTVAASGDFQIEWLTVGEVGDDGRSIRGIQFDPDDLDAALAQLDLLASAGRRRPPQTLASLAGVTATRLASDGRWDDFRRVIHPAFVLEDRRKGLAARQMDLDGLVQASESMEQVGLYWQASEVEAARGELLVLMRHTFGADDNLMETSSVVQTDEFGRIRRSITFDPGDTDAAEAELDRLADEVGVVPHPMVAPNRAAFFCFISAALTMEGRWEELGRYQHPEFEAEDRRPFATEPLVDGGRTLEGLRLVTDRALRIIQEVVATRGDRLALLRYQYGDEHFDEDQLVVVQFDADDRCPRVIQFAPEDLDAALAELDRLERDVDSGHPLVAAMERGMRFALAGDWDGYRDGMLPGYRYLSRRKQADFSDLDREAMVAIARSGIEELGLTIQANDLVESRGDRLVLIRNREALPDGFRSESLLVVRADEDGRLELVVHFDNEDLDAARAELDRLAEGMVPRAANRAVMVNEANLALMATGRWEELRMSAHPDFVMEDRRSVPTEPVLTGDRAVHSAIATEDFGLRLTRNEVVATRGDLLALMRQSFADGAFESSWLALLQIDGSGRSVRYIQFDSHDTGPALAELDRLAELSSTAPPDDVSQDPALR